MIVRLLKVCVALLVMSAPMSAQAAIDAYEFKTDDDQARFHVLVQELRCPKCQNQNLSDSNAEIAKDLREQVYLMVNDGQSNDQIVDFMVDRYGDFVRYKPKMDPSTYVLWFAPFVLLGIGGIAIFFLVTKRRPVTMKVDVTAPSVSAPKRELSGEDKAALDNLLNKKDVSE